MFCERAPLSTKCQGKVLYGAPGGGQGLQATRAWASKLGKEGSKPIRA